MLRLVYLSLSESKPLDITPQLLGLKNISVKYLDDTIDFKNVDGVFRCLPNSWCITRPATGEDHVYTPHSTFYGNVTKITKPPSGIEVYGVEDKSPPDPDILRVFKNVCMKHKGLDVHLRISGRNKGRFYILRNWYVVPSTYMKTTKVDFKGLI